MSIYKEGQLVWAKIKGYNWWPAKVMESNEKKNGQISKEVKVEFIGEGKSADIPISKLVDFQENYSQHSVTKNQKLIEVLKAIPRVPFLQLSQGHENGSLNFTFDSILLESKSDVSEGENHYYPHKTHTIEIPSLSQTSHKKTSTSNTSLRAVDENKSLNAKRNMENRQESNSRPLFRCSYETIPDLIQGESERWQIHNDSLIDPPFYNSHQKWTEEELREFAHSERDSSERESEEEEDEDEDYEMIQKKLKVETSKNKPKGRRGKRTKTVAVKEPVVAAAVVVKKEKGGNDVKSKSTCLIEGLVKRLLEMYENNKIQLIEEGQNYRGFSMPLKSKNKYSAEELANKDIKRMVESMRDLLSQVILWLAENLQGADKITLINLIYDIVDGAIQGSIPFFQQLKHFFLTTYEFLLKNKQLTNIMDNNMITSIIDLVHEIESPEYEESGEVPVPHITIPSINEKENAKCESVNHVERSTRKASGTSSESNSHIAEHMTEKEQEEEQNLEHYEEEIKEVNYEELMKNMLLRRNVCQKLAKLFQKLYKITSNSAQDLVLLVEGRIQSFFHQQNIESYVKSIRILYKLIKMEAIKFSEIEMITYMEFDDFREMLENKIHQKDDFSFQTEVILNIQPGYSSLVLDDEIEMI